MGVAYHTHYLVWCEAARTEHMRARGITYRVLEDDLGVRLAVVDAQVRYRAAARYDDVLRIGCWVRAVTSRTVDFGYLIERVDGGQVLATARTVLIALNSTHALSRLPKAVRAALAPTPDPVSLF